MTFCKEGFDLFNQHFNLLALDERRIGTYLFSELFIFFLCAGGQQDNGNLFVAFVKLEEAANLITVNFRKHNVQNDQIRFDAFGEREPPFSGRRGVNYKALGIQNDLYRL